VEDPGQPGRFRRHPAHPERGGKLPELCTPSEAATA